MKTTKPEKIKELRSLMGVTQTEFADEMGITQKTVSAWETGANDVPDIVMLLIDRMLKEYE